jgi:pimeloyl-ACP methyl ester carboxylesterase
VTTVRHHARVVRAERPQVVEANGVDLCVQTFGDESAPAVLLIGGAAASMDWWEEELCERLAAGPRFVIRYDFRDTGQSVTYEPGVPEYSGDDLVADAVGLLDALAVPRAHVVGLSMGGGIAQHLAVSHPGRVASLTLMSTSPGPSGPDEPNLPPMSKELAAFQPPPEPDWSDREAVADYVVAGLFPYAGSVRFDEDRMRALVGQIVDRTIDMRSSQTNHWIIEGGEPVRHRLGEIEAPTLVLHGTEDPLFPIAHGEALARKIPGARLVPVEGVGHEYPPPQVWDEVVEAILDHTARAGAG